MIPHRVGLGFQLLPTRSNLERERQLVNNDQANFPGIVLRRLARTCEIRGNGIMEFQEKVRLLLKLQRRSQLDLAEDIGTTQPQMSRWLQNNKPPSAEYLLRMARSLKVSADYLIDPAQSEPPKDGLTDDEKIILRIARGMPADEAIRRLSNVPGTFGGVTSARPEAPGSSGKSVKGQR